MEGIDPFIDYLSSTRVSSVALTAAVFKRGGADDAARLEYEKQQVKKAGSFMQNLGLFGC